MGVRGLCAVYCPASVPGGLAFNGPQQLRGFGEGVSLLKRSLEIGADYIATGHYARIEQLPNGRYAIRNSVTARKDQTYALYNLTQEQLSKTLMPVGAYTKEEIRQIAEEAGLPVAQKKDSQEICFVPDKDYAGFIEQSTGEKIPKGNYVLDRKSVV